jgi:hypothetical protein
MKRYKIDFNNGKVFEAVRKTDSIFWFDGSAYCRKELERLGATITEIKEPRKEWWIVKGSFVYAAKTTKREAENLEWAEQPPIHAVELREGEVIVDRERIIEAFGSNGFITTHMNFEGSLKELGL